MAATLTAQIITRFESGAVKAQTAGFQFILDQKGRVSWATPEGWARIATDGDNFPAWSHKASWGEGFNFQDDQYAFAGRLV